MFSVIFEVRPGEGRKDEYLAHAGTLKPILESIDGFIDNERFESRSRPGWVLSHSTWRDEKAVIRWRTEFRHHETQEKGRFDVFADYHLRVGEVIADSHPPLPVREQRFDTTEAGHSKACTIVELTPREGRMFPGDDGAILGPLGLSGAQGLDTAEVYASIYNPGKLLVLGSWATPEEATRFRPGGIDGAAATRLRSVRIIRDYGMFDRRETPQYYPEVERRG